MDAATYPESENPPDPSEVWIVPDEPDEVVPNPDSFWNVNNPSGVIWSKQFVTGRPDGNGQT